MSTLDNVSPSGLGQKVIALTVLEGEAPTVAHAVDVAVDYSAAAPAGVSLPVELVVQGPTEAGYYRHIYRRVLPAQLTFFPVVGGPHLVRLRELAHNRYFGSLQVDVAGDST